MTPIRTKLEQNLGWLALGLLLAACVRVLLPFFTALLWAAILSWSLWPLHGRIARRLGGRGTLAALLLTLALVAAVLLPFVAVGLSLADNFDALAAGARRWLERGLPPPPAWLPQIPLLGPAAAGRWAAFAGDGGQLLQQAERLIEPLRGLVRAGAATLFGGLFAVGLSLLLTFLMLGHGAAIGAQVESFMNRIAGGRGHYLLQLAGSTVRGVVYGILGTALLQSAMAGAGFLAAGVPAAGLLALLIFPLSVVPGGPLLVMLPAAFWLFHQGATGWGVFMVVWAVIVGAADNVVRPWLISQGSAMPFMVVLLGVLGGALAFGFIGVFIGPTLLAVCWRLVGEWITRTPVPGREAGGCEAG
ncbi:MAG TPA: AI-2E family transporter [Verrucomicrobiota bacterium]|nr:AI-2E family transporter [Verrucomicrobiota bacterium]